MSLILPQLVTARDLSATTGIPLWRLYELTRSGGVPHVRLGRAVRYDPEAVASWIAAGGTGPYTAPTSEG